MHIVKQQFKVITQNQDAPNRTVIYLFLVHINQRTGNMQHLSKFIRLSFKCNQNVDVIKLIQVYSMIYSEASYDNCVFGSQAPSSYEAADNFHQCDIQKIMSGLYISDQFASKNRKLLDDLSVKHIVVVGQELKPVFNQQFNYLHIPVRDSKKESINHHFQTTNKFIDEALSKKQIVLVHCAKGKSRSATIILAYLISKHKMSFQQAYNFMKRKRRETSPNEGFILQLKKYEKNLQQNKIQFTRKKF